MSTIDISYGRYTISYDTTIVSYLQRIACQFIRMTQAQHSTRQYAYLWDVMYVEIKYRIIWVMGPEPHGRQTISNPYTDFTVTIMQHDHVMQHLCRVKIQNKLFLRVMREGGR